MSRVKKELSIRDASKLLPMSEDLLKKWLRDSYLMKCKPCPYGDALLSDDNQWQYYIYPNRLDAFLNAKDLTSA